MKRDPAEHSRKSRNTVSYCSLKSSQRQRKIRPGENVYKFIITLWAFALTPGTIPRIMTSLRQMDAANQRAEGVRLLKSVMSASQVHKQYSEAVTAYRKLIPDPTLRMAVSRGMDEYMRTCALGVWQADSASGIQPEHVEYYNAIYTAGAPSPAALYWEVATGVANYDLFQPPAFFDRLRQYDRQRGTVLARRFADTLTLMMLLFAAVDGVVSESEAGFINACADTMAALCDQDGLKGDRPALRADEFITKAPAAGSAAQKPAPKVQEKKPEEEPAPEPPPKLEDVLAELDGLCGLDQVKKDVKSLINLVKVRKLRQAEGLPVPPMSLHLVFMGNPGTGKTTVARLLAKIYYAIGVLSKGQLVEVDRSGLVAGFVGQTAIKTQEAVQKALGGVLFIDEAYSLVNQENGNDFGHEAIEILLKNMEDHRNDLIVIVAGYTNLMEKFIHSNPGLESRFNKYFFFEDYTGAQLMEIFRSQCKRNGYTLAKDAEEWAVQDFDQLFRDRDENFGNAREVRNLFEKAVARQADRVAALESPTKEQLMELTLADLKELPEDEHTEEEKQ